MSGEFNPEIKRILVIDGYAFRGIGPLYIIDRIVRNASFRAKRALLPCDVFDLICGTSSGALIAIMLGRLRLDCDTALSEYKNLVRQCCGDDETQLWKNILANTEFKAHSYTTALASLIERHASSSDALMLYPPALSPAKPCQVSVVVTAVEPDHTGQAHCIRSFRAPTTIRPASHQWLIREAAYAALATTFYGYAPPICIENKYTFQDSAFFGFNNPIVLAQRESNLLWPNTRDLLIISLGTNISSLVPRSVQSKWESWSATDAYFAPYVDKIIAKLGTTTDAERCDAAHMVKKLVYVSAETTGEHLKAATSLILGSYYRIDPPTNLDPIAFTDILWEETIKDSIDRWCEDAEGKDIMTNVVVSLVIENTRPIAADSIRSLDPPPPPVGTVNTGYNPQLDKRRPTTVMEYLQKYHVLFIVDDSKSMESLWDEAREALAGIAQHALDYNAHSVDLAFLNNTKVATQIQGKPALLSAFSDVSLSKGTPTGAALKRHLDEHIRKLNAAANSPDEYGKIAPLDIIVITDGRPNDKPRPEDVIADTEKTIKAGKHHPNCIGIQFVQIGNDAKAQHALQNLSYNAAKVGMVDTVPYNGKTLTTEELQRILLGGICHEIDIT